MNVNVRSNNNKMLTNEEVRRLIAQSQQGDKLARNTLVEKNVRLVWSVVQRFLNRGYDPDDLFPYTTLFRSKAIDKFDLSYDVRFSTYAVPMIIGEIQRFIRDDGTMKVSRTMKELGNKIRIKKEELSKKLNRSPTVLEIAEALDMTPEDVSQAQEAVKSPHSIHETAYENLRERITLLDQIPNKDKQWFEKLTLEEAIRNLTERERLIVYLRYYKDQTQSEVAERLGISQVQVSRLEKKILMDMKQMMRQ